jgi:hypothetical protein
VRGRGLFPAVIGAAAFAAVAFSGLTAEARGGGRPAAAWRIAPEPAWIVAAPAAGPAPAPVDESVFECLLDDTQVRVSGATVEHYHHVRYRPRSPRQVEDGSQVELEVNPAYERLVIHHVRVERAGHPVGTYGARDVKVVQREKDLDERIYDGSLSALVFLRDVRVGDIIDYAYTLEERQPLLGGKYAARFRLGDESFNATWRMRILLPAERSLNVKPRGIDVPPTVTTANGWREYRWQRQNVAPIEPEDGLPAWFDPEPWIDVSELGSWAEVASLFQRTYQVDARPSPALTEQIARLRAAGGTDEDRLLAATRFVQDDIRYLGVELGLGGARPFQPSTVLARRFGDCKDKAGLLVTLLRALGFDARTALVSTRERRALDDALPSPLVFDHAIVQVALAGPRHKNDATAS